MWHKFHDSVDIENGFFVDVDIGNIFLSLQFPLSVKFFCKLGIYEMSRFVGNNFSFDFFTIDSNFGSSRDVAQPGSVLAWGARGRWFESSHPDFFKSKIPFTKCKWDFVFL